MTARTVTAPLVGVLAVGVVLGVAFVAMTRTGAPGSASSTPLLPSAPAASAAALASPAVSAAVSPDPTGSAPPDSSAAPLPSPSASPYTGPVTRRVPVLMYHRIADPPPGAPYPGLFVSPISFDAQMHALHDAGWRTITAGELGAAMASDQPVPVRTLVVMFDDGYEDNFTAALPILQRYGFVATFSVVASGGGSMMTSAQLAALVGAGMEIGNHTLHHRNVANLGSAVLSEEIDGGAARIESRLAEQGVTYVPKTFVYPSGHVGPAAVALLQKDGYTDAFTEVPGVAVIGTSQPLEIPRIRVSRFEDLGAFLAAMPVEPLP